MEASGSSSFATVAATSTMKDLTDTTKERTIGCKHEASREQATGYNGILECSTCKNVYPYKEDCYWDLTLGSGCTGYSKSTTPYANMFRTALVSFFYERGWRQSFALGGFPGPCKEFEHAKDFLKPVTGGVIIDASCGTGPFSRLFIKSKLYSQVVALDFSENMLKQCNKFMKEEMISDKQQMMVKADISRLPFTSNSIDAIHAGAALHSWPSPANAVAEISRVLRPGGILVASTFMFDVVPLAIPALRIVRKYVSQYLGYNTFLSEDELEGLCKACGLVDFKCVRKGLYIMLSATKAT
uniref:Methyltransferase type 11 domain-containing protein n=1 Tax=Leersia perrieri TaxID=77586 RepID=A0A0D9VEQ8_9ORYZ